MNVSCSIALKMWILLKIKLFLILKWFLKTLNILCKVILYVEVIATFDPSQEIGDYRFNPKKYFWLIGC